MVSSQKKYQLTFRYILNLFLKHLYKRSGIRLSSFDYSFQEC